MIDSSKIQEISSPSDFNVNVTIKGRQFKIYCSSRQRIRWLLDVVIHKFDRNFALNSGLPYGAKLDNNDLLNLDDNINSVLKNNDHLTVLLKDDFELYLEDSKKKNRSPTKSPPKKQSVNKAPSKKK